MSMTTITIDRPTRTQALAWAKRTAADANAVYIDTETTGIGDDAEIVDIAIIANDGQVLFDSLVKPQRPIPDGASRVHGIYDQDVEDAPDWPNIAGQVFDLLEGRRVIVYNADYDYRIVAAVSNAYGVSMPDAQWECAMLAYAEFSGEMVVNKGRGFLWHRLDQAARAFNIEPGGHRARQDAEACRQVVHAMAVAR